MPPLPSPLPVAIVGGGPIGLAAAAHCAERGLPFHLIEAGPRVAANVRDWGHVRLFSPWRWNIDAAARRQLEATGWRTPDPEALPTGDALADAYLDPLAAALSAHGRIETGARVVAITRRGIGKIRSRGREERPFALHLADADGARRVVLARAVIDASGTWNQPNPMGADGVPAPGEEAAAERVATRIPDVFGADRALYEGGHVLVVGAGHSAANALVDLARLARETGRGSVVWAVRGASPLRAFGGGARDELSARGALGDGVRGLVETGTVALVTGFETAAIEADTGGLVVEALDGRRMGPFDRILALAGHRPDFAMTRELRVDFDPTLESVRALAPEIDPNLHACGSVAPHGHRLLAQPEPGYHAVGMKSYGRAPTFLMATGYEQVRSVVAALAGAMEEADRVALDLPKTGVCVTDASPAAGLSCCGSEAEHSEADLVDPEPVAVSAPRPARASCCGSAA